MAEEPKQKVEAIADEVTMIRIQKSIILLMMAALLPITGHTMKQSKKVDNYLPEAPCRYIVEAVNKKLADEGITDTYASDSRWYIDIVSHDFDEAEISRCYEYIQEYRSKYWFPTVSVYATANKYDHWIIGDSMTWDTEKGEYVITLYPGNIETIKARQQQ